MAEGVSRKGYGAGKECFHCKSITGGFLACLRDYGNGDETSVTVPSSGCNDYSSLFYNLAPHVYPLRHLSGLDALPSQLIAQGICLIGSSSIPPTPTPRTRVKNWIAAVRVSKDL